MYFAFGIKELPDFGLDSGFGAESGARKLGKEWPGAEPRSGLAGFQAASKPAMILLPLIPSLKYRLSNTCAFQASSCVGCRTYLSSGVQKNAWSRNGNQKPSPQPAK